MAAILVMGTAQAQNKPTTSKTSSSKTTSSKSSTSKKKKGAPEKPKVEEVQLPYNSNDCIFAIDLNLDMPYGPTTAPQGAGRVMDVVRDKTNPNAIEYEHNTVWYKFKVPYSGFLEIDITQANPADDYDFMVYRYTDVYFSNHMIQNKIKPIASSLALPDTAAVAGKPQQGMSIKAQKYFLDSKAIGGFVKSIPVKMGEIYYICLDNKAAKGSGHTIKASIYVDSYEPKLVFWDEKDKKYLDVDLLMIEKASDGVERTVVKKPNFKGERVKLVPGFQYTMYAKKPGYFSFYRVFQSDIFKYDTIARITMTKAQKGSVFSLKNVYFDDNGALLPESDTVLLNYVALLKNHPEVTFDIKGYVQSYGVDVQKDQQISLARAQSVKEFFIKHDIAEDRMKVRGMTPSEIKKEAAAAINTNKFKEVKIELIITQAAQ